jgi:threonine dehydratase
VAQGGTTLSPDDVERARERIGGRLHRTPVLGSRTLSDRLGADVRFKAELFQRTGSFKPRGVFSKLATLTPGEKARGVISISAGNHAQALAYAAALEGIDALVVMWRDASALKVEATRGYGATVDLEAEDSVLAFARLGELMESTGRMLVHPFDDPLVIAGQGTVGLEIAEDVPGARTVVVPAGGGGLVSGVAAALAGTGVRVIAVEPELSPALHESLRAGRSVTVQPESEADGLNAPFAGARCVEICTALGVESVLVSEEELHAGFHFVYGRLKLACEPAGAAAAAALLAGKIELEPGSTAVGVVSGGNVEPRTAAAILARQ